MPTPDVDVIGRRSKSSLPYSAREPMPQLQRRPRPRSCYRRRFRGLGRRRRCGGHVHWPGRRHAQHQSRGPVMVVSKERSAADTIFDSPQYMSCHSAEQQQRSGARRNELAKRH